LATGSSGSTAACSAPCGAPPPQLTLLFVPAAYTGAGGVPWIGLVLLVLRDPQEELGKVTWRYLRASRRARASRPSRRHQPERTDPSTPRFPRLRSRLRREARIDVNVIETPVDVEAYVAEPYPAAGEAERGEHLGHSHPGVVAAGGAVLTFVVVEPGEEIAVRRYVHA
jgi:hypothetical protein